MKDNLSLSHIYFEAQIMTSYVSIYVQSFLIIVIFNSIEKGKEKDRKEWHF